MAKLFDFTFPVQAIAPGAGIPVAGAAVNTPGGTLVDAQGVWSVDEAGLARTTGTDFLSGRLYYTGHDATGPQTLVAFSGPNANDGGHSLAIRGASGNSDSYIVSFRHNEAAFYVLGSISSPNNGSTRYKTNVPNNHQAAYILSSRSIPGSPNTLAQEVTLCVVDLTDGIVRLAHSFPLNQLLTAQPTYYPLVSGRAGLGYMNDPAPGSFSRMMVFNGSLDEVSADPAFAGITTPLAGHVTRVWGDTTKAFFTAGPSLVPAGYTRRWDRSETLNFTPSDATKIDGQTGPTLEATLPDGKLYHFSTSLVSGGNTIVATSNNSPAFRHDHPVARVASIGDSITSERNRVDLRMLGSIKGTRDVYGGNFGISGSPVSGWIGGGGYYATYRDRILASVGDPTKAVASVMFGANDARGGSSTADYIAQLTTLCNAILADGFSKIIVHYPSFVDGFAHEFDGIRGNANTWSVAAINRMAEYRTALDTFANGTTIVLGNKSLSQYPAEHFDLSTDGIHPYSPDNGGFLEYHKPAQSTIGMAIYCATYAASIAEAIDGSALVAEPEDPEAIEATALAVFLPHNLTIGQASTFTVVLTGGAARDAETVVNLARTGATAAASVTIPAGQLEITSPITYTAASVQVVATATGMTGDTATATGVAAPEIPEEPTVPTLTADEIAQATIAALFSKANAFRPGETFKQSLRKVLSSTAGDVDRTTDPTKVQYKLGGEVIFTHALAARTTITNGPDL